MGEAIRQAKKGVGHTGPNPSVGAVIALGGKIVARGHHRRAGAPHAEIEVISAARENGCDLSRATLYCTLEPCQHRGKTGACVEAIIAARIPRVVFGCIDPNPIVSGRGAQALRAAGVEVVGPCREAECRELIADFALAIAAERPFVVVKAGVSIDGRIATYAGESQWITSEASRAHARRLRGHVQAVIVGQKTAAIDDPRLTARTRGLPEPLRVIVDSTLRTAPSAAAVSGPTPGCLIVACGGEPSAEAALAEAGAKIWRVGARAGQVDLAEMLHRLYRELGMTRVLVEGGGALIGAFADQRLIDQIDLFIAGKLLGGAAPSFVMGSGVAALKSSEKFVCSTLERLGEDVHLIWRRQSEGAQPSS